MTDTLAPQNPTPTDAQGRSTEFTMPIQGGMLEALGINMYTKLGKCLVEFIANAYDGEATKIELTIPIEEIMEERKKVREAAKADVAAGTRDAYDALLDPLPTSVAVTIIDDGHGMTWQDVAQKFLPLNRKRRLSKSDGRETKLMSENGKRFVMGRKGLGKLAGFGAAEHMRIWTKREGQTFATVFSLEDRTLKNADNVTNVPIPAIYEEDLDTAEKGTRITLTGLKSDAVKEDIADIKSTIIEAFSAIRPEEFSIYLNGDLLQKAVPDYEFIWPDSLAQGDYATKDISIEEIGDMSIRYYVGFLPRGSHLPARKRGARIYCNNRLAAGPSLFGLPSGMHSFHSADYMECIVEADELDRVGIDFINTNRSELKEDNDVVRALLQSVTELMQDAVRAHGKFRDEKAKEEVEKDPAAKILNDVVSALPNKTRKPAQKLLHALASEYGVSSTQFQELAPVLISSVNATDVLIRLIDLQSKPDTITKVAAALQELGEIEKADALKLYRGRRSGIVALRTLMDEGVEQWGKKRLEKDLHNLLKRNPWIIRPEFSQYLTSDVDLNKVVTQIARELKVDEFSPILDDSGDADATRPDLVFLMSDPSAEGPHVMNVIELKSPTLGLDMDHYRQLEDYIDKISQWCSAELEGTISVRGYLIGAMPDATKANFKQKQVLDKFSDQGANAQIRIVGMNQLLKDTWQAHIDAIKALEVALDDDEPEVPALAVNSPVAALPAPTKELP